jgi:hypothetical protein
MGDDDESSAIQRYEGPLKARRGKAYRHEAIGSRLGGEDPRFYSFGSPLPEQARLGFGMCGFLGETLD